LTTTTPLEALDPYIAPDAASFRTEIDSISLGLSKLISPSIPSIITRGAELFNVDTPLIRIEISSCPASPEFWETNTPAVVPDKAAPALVKDLFSITSESIVATEPVIFLNNWVP